MLCACEVIADFDRQKLEEQRTIGPTPLPTVDGATPLIPDAAQPDGALIGPGRDDDGGLDAALEAADAGDAAADAASTADAAGLDAASEPEVVPEPPDATVLVESGN
jgi:hypothetical protein